MASYDRYTQFRQDGEIKIVPYGKVPAKNTDFYETYFRGKTSLDILSYKYYNDSNYAWLIMQANPQYGSIEFEIPDMATLRIPYPLSQSIQDYVASIEEYNKLYK
jgi:hypothetical protein